MKYNDSLIVKRVPKWIRERTRENMEVYSMGLYDAFNDAVLSYPKRASAALRNAWYFSDYREYIPSAYLPRFLNFTEYPPEFRTGRETK